MRDQTVALFFYINKGGFALLSLLYIFIYSPFDSMFSWRFLAYDCAEPIAFSGAGEASGDSCLWVGNMPTSVSSWVSSSHYGGGPSSDKPTRDLAHSAPPQYPPQAPGGGGLRGGGTGQQVAAGKIAHLLEQVRRDCLETTCHMQFGFFRWIKFENGMGLGGGVEGPMGQNTPRPDDMARSS